MTHLPKTIVALLCLCFSIVACNGNIGAELPEAPVEQAVAAHSITIRTSVESQNGTSTKTTLTSGNKVSWCTGDSFSLLNYSQNKGTKNTLKVTVSGTSSGVGILVSGVTQAYVKYEGIRITDGNGNDITSSIVSTSTSSNSYKVGIYNSIGNYQYAPAGSTVTAQINSTNNVIPLVQSSSSATNLPIIVYLTGISYSTDKTSWTAVDENSTLQNGSSWNKSDLVYSWEGSTAAASNTQFTISPDDAGSTSAAFTGTISDPDGDYYALYPYDTANSINGTAVSFSLPQFQTYAEGSFQNGANPMAGKLETLNNDEYKVDFANLCGVLRLNLKGSEQVTAIEVTDNSGAKLWGEATADVSKLSSKTCIAEIISGGSSTITLNCPYVQLSEETATAFHIVVPAGTLSEGFSVSVTTSYGVGTKGTSAANTIGRSVILEMPPLSTDSFEFTIPEFNIENPTVQDVMANSYSSFVSGSSSYLDNSTFIANRSSAIANGYRNDQPAMKTISFATGEATSAQVQMATDLGFSNKVLDATIALSGSESSYTFQNMVPGETYYYNVTAASSGTKLASGAFKTVGQLRMIRIDDSWNIRDMGGWTGWSGNKVRYEWLYRGGSIGGQSGSESTYSISDESKEEVRRIGWAAHLDLRSITTNGAWANGSQLNSHTLGYSPLSWADFLNLCTDWGLYYASEYSPAVGDLAFIIKEVKAGKPTYFHCRTGADRTGVVGMTILSLLGCEEYTAGNSGNQIAMDYELTSLGMDEEGTINYNKYGTVSGYSSRAANGIQGSQYNYFRTVRGLKGTTPVSGITLTSIQDAFYYYLNRYFYDNSVTSAGSAYINKSDLDWFINFMLGITDIGGNVMDGKTLYEGPSWAKEYENNTLDTVISTAVAHQYK